MRRKLMKGAVALGVLSAGVLFGGLISGTAGAAETIKIGAIYSLTGDMAIVEDPAYKAAQLAVDEINGAGGIKGQQIELIHYDGKSSVTDFSNAAQRLVHEDGVVAVIGACDSSLYLAGAAITQEAGIPFLDTGGTVPDLPAQVGEYGHMMPFGDDYQAFVAADFALGDLGAKTAYILRDSDTDYTRAIAQFFKERFLEKGGQIIGESSYHSGDTDYSAHITKVRGLDPAPDVIYAAVLPGDDAVVVRQFREAGVTLPIVGGDALDSPEFIENSGKGNSDNVYFTTHMALKPDGGKVSKFIEGYQAKFGYPPENAFAGLGYDSVYLMAEAMKRASELTPEAINAAIPTIDNFDGVSGKADFEVKGRAPHKEVTLIAVKEGQFTLVGNRTP